MSRGRNWKKCPIPGCWREPESGGGREVKDGYQRTYKCAAGHQFTTLEAVAQIIKGGQELGPPAARPEFGAPPREASTRNSVALAISGRGCMRAGYTERNDL